MSMFDVAKVIQKMHVVNGLMRLRKTIYLLQQAGMPLYMEFEFGHFGPWSRSLESNVDILVRDKLVTEHCKVGSEYQYVYT